MGLLVDGKWTDQWYDTKSSGGKFVRKDAAFRNWVTPDGSPGPSGSGGFKAEAGRYHLYVAYACPWAHRTLIFRELKGLQDIIPISAVQPLMLEMGWSFGDGSGEGVIPDSVNHVQHIHQLYMKAVPDYTGRATVPILWDKARETIVSNESSEIIRMFNSAFDGAGAKDGNYYPAALRDKIDEVNDLVYSNVNNGVYKAGFATEQDAYEDAVTALFDALDRLETRLGETRYLVGNRITEADWRLFTTLLRFDPVYFGHFKCNIRRIVDYPNLWNYVLDLYQQPGIAGTCNLAHIKQHYYGSHETVNPTRIVPLGPEIDYTQPHDRNRFSS
ncbi:MAG: glutathione S-transferase family protein [Fimbriimonadaceae bacterium]|nr:glutathione S-transferase family protein [Alphaproteobacteria bacterium]